MPHPRYADLAALVGVPHCRGITAGGSYCHLADHDRGASILGTVHWRDRRPTLPGLYHFLFLAAWAIHANEYPWWRRFYLAHRDVPLLAAKAHIRLPARLSGEARRRLKAILVTIPRTDPLREEAARWASR